MSLYLGNTVISGVTTPIDGSIAIGQIISSIIPLTDAGLHLLDGSLIQGSGIYNNFVQYIANLFNLYPQCFTDETTWQNTVNSKGVCGKFVYNSTNNTVRLPKITGFIEGTVDSNALGELVDAGLPNITGDFNIAGYSDNTTSLITDENGAFNRGSLVITDSGCNFTGGTGKRYKYLFDASRSNSVYGNSTTVQPQSIKVFYYIVVATTTTKTDIEVDIDEVITDLNSKANDIDVIHKTGEETITGHKIFINNIDRIVNAIRGQTPSSNFYSDIRFIDNNNNWLAGLEYSLLTDKSSRISLILSDSVGDTTNVKGMIEIGEFSDGNIYTYAPACSINGSIITSESMFKADGIDDSQNNYVKFGNGLLIQWGHIQKNSQQLNVTFPIPFRNNAYRMFTQDTGQLSGYSYAGVTGVTRTTTGATLYSYYSNRYYDWLAIGFWY